MSSQLLYSVLPLLRDELIILTIQVLFIFLLWRKRLLKN